MSFTDEVTREMDRRERTLHLIRFATEAERVQKPDAVLVCRADDQEFANTVEAAKHVRNAA